MCRDCGCEEASREHKLWLKGRPLRPAHPENIPMLPRRILMEQAVLAKNIQIAAENRRWFTANRIRVLNLMSSPGSGKTLLLEKTVQQLAGRMKMAILAGDQSQDYDAQRLKRAGAEVLQLNTGNSCHLDAGTIQKQLGSFVQPGLDLLVIENVGNLVCPAAFDLGESEKIALLSATEGEDKPSKYPLLFHEASLIVLTKIDLIPHLDWSLELCEKHIRKVNARAPVLKLSARTGEGLGSWIDFLLTRHESLVT